MSFLSSLRSVFRGEWYRRPSRDTQKDLPVEPARQTAVSLEEWRSRQMHSYASRRKQMEGLERDSAAAQVEAHGLSGTLISALILEAPPLLLRNVWGGDLGWLKPAKRGVARASLVERPGSHKRSGWSAPELRPRFNAVGPPISYVPPPWALATRTFQVYFGGSPTALDLAREWDRQNNSELTLAIER